MLLKRFLIFNPKLNLLQSSSSASSQGMAIHEALKTLQQNTSVSTFMPCTASNASPFPSSPSFHTSFSPLIFPVVRLFCECDLRVSSGMPMPFKLNFPRIKTTAALQFLSFSCPNSTGYVEDENNHYSAFTISPRLLRRVRERHQ